MGRKENIIKCQLSSQKNPKIGTNAALPLPKHWDTILILSVSLSKRIFELML